MSKNPKAVLFYSFHHTGSGLYFSEFVQIEIKVQFLEIKVSATQVKSLVSKDPITNDEEKLQKKINETFSLNNSIDNLAE